MADDDRGPEPDPWDDIVADGLDGDLGELSLRPDGDDPAAPSVADGDATSPGAAAASGDGQSASDDIADAAIDDWLHDVEVEPHAGTPSSGFAPEDAAAGSSAIDIGTGTSGAGTHGAFDSVGSDADVNADFNALDEIGVTDEAAAAWAGIESVAGDSAADEIEDGCLPDVDAAAAAGVAVNAGPSTKPTPRPRKSGLGPLVGVALGGVAAIPITLAILIFGLGKDPLGVTKAVPSQVAFLLPQKFRPGQQPSPAFQPAGLEGGAAPDQVPAVDEPEPLTAALSEPEPSEPGPQAASEPGPEPESQPEPEVQPDEPAVPASAQLAEPVADEVAPVADPVVGVEPGPIVDSIVAVEPEPVVDVAAPPEPEPLTDQSGVAGLDALDTAPVSPPEPPPLDTAALDAAVGDAAALSTALGTVADKNNRAYKLLRTRWYRALARVAEELVAVEHMAASSGRPLTQSPDTVGALHGDIGASDALVAELATLAPDWLAYERRGSDGVVVPATLESARRVGPYWAARVTLTGADGLPRDFTVISRVEPMAAAGDRVIVTGVALDGAVIWAADVRASVAEPTTGS